MIIVTIMIMVVIVIIVIVVVVVVAVLNMSVIIIIIMIIILLMIRMRIRMRLMFPHGFLVSLSPVRRLDCAFWTPLVVRHWLKRAAGGWATHPQKNKLMCLSVSIPFFGGLKRRNEPGSSSREDRTLRYCQLRLNHSEHWSENGNLKNSDWIPVQRAMQDLR